MIANAIVAKFGTMSSASEMDLAFSVLQKLPTAYSQALLSINAKSREHYDDSLIDSFWLALKKRYDALPPNYFNLEGGSPKYIVVRNHLYSLVEQAILDVSDELLHDPLNLKVRNRISQKYWSSTINRYVLSELLLRYVLNRHDPEVFPKMLKELLIEIDNYSPTTGKDPAETRRFAVRVLTQTARLIPLSLQKRLLDKEESPVSMEGCQLLQDPWPSGKYPTIIFSDSCYLAEVDFRRVQFDDRTLTTLIPFQDVQFNEIFNREINALFGTDVTIGVFDTFSESSEIELLHLSDKMTQRFRSLTKTSSNELEGKQ